MWCIRHEIQKRSSKKKLSSFARHMPLRRALMMQPPKHIRNCAAFYRLLVLFLSVLLCAVAIIFFSLWQEGKQNPSRSENSTFKMRAHTHTHEMGSNWRKQFSFRMPSCTFCKWLLWDKPFSMRCCLYRRDYVCVLYWNCTIIQEKGQIDMCWSNAIGMAFAHDHNRSGEMI